MKTPGEAVTGASRRKKICLCVWALATLWLTFASAVYAVRGTRDIYFAFHFDGDPGRNAAPQVAQKYTQLQRELEERLEECFSRGNIGSEERRRIRFLTDVWMGEMVAYDRGDKTCCCPLLAPEAERHGDFTGAVLLRRGEARFYRAVAVPFHQGLASTCEQAGRHNEARLHRQAVTAYQEEATLAETLAQGDRLLARIEGLGGRGEVHRRQFALFPHRENPVLFQHIYNRWWRHTSDARSSGQPGWEPGAWLGPSAEEVATILKARGLSHSEESARLSAVTVLANLGQREAVLAALSDPSGTVRLAAARALLSWRWAEGRAACADHPDREVRALTEPLLEPAGHDVMTHTYVITELVHGSAAPSRETRAFCQDALNRVTGKNLQGEAWTRWWQSLGGAEPGLPRTGPGVPPEVDAQVDFGGWWRGIIQNAPNALTRYGAPATISWDGYVVVTRPGQYRFTVRSLGEGITQENMVRFGGGQPTGFWFQRPCVKLAVDGKALIPNPPNEVADPTCGMRLDLGSPIRLNEGLHRIHLEYEWRGGRVKDIWFANRPTVRLYWEGEHFLRRLVPAEHLVTMRGRE